MFLGDMDTDDEHDPSLSQAISCAISGVNIAVYDTGDDVPEPIAEEAERTVVLNSLKDFWVEQKKRTAETRRSARRS